MARKGVSVFDVGGEAELLEWSKVRGSLFWIKGLPAT